MSSDGSKLHESWLAALKHAQDRFRSLLSSNTATDNWKRVPVPSASGDNATGSGAAGANGLVAASSTAKGKHRPRVSDVVMHRRTVKGDDVVRVVLEIPADDGLASLDAWKAVLATPELRKEWDPTVEASSIVETCFDPDTRISKTDFTLGWPANPRDAITISRTFADATTLIDISTSLPRSPDEPGYLRPAPPFVRSHVHLFAWCIQIIAPPSESSSRAPSTPKIRITCFWQHDLKAIWGTNNLAQNLPAVVVGLVRSVRKRGSRTPTLSGWGNGVGLDNIAFNIDREALRLDYSIFPEDLSNSAKSENMDLQTFQEKKRLERAIEVVVPLAQGWDVQISTRASSEDTSKLPWTVHATRIMPTNLPPQLPEASRSSTPSPPGSSPSYEPQYVAFRLVHSRPPEHAVLKVKVVMELSGGSNGLRVNGSPHPIEDSESRDPTTLPKDFVADGRSVSGLSFQSISTVESQASSATQQTSPLVRSGGDRTPAAEKSILSLVRRNYIYFTSLLQEPEAKWRHLTESRGVTISQLDSIDPTLVVYRAEAVFVGVGIWDLFSIIKTPGSRIYWDRGYDDAVLLEDVNELTELWRHSTKAVWPVNARDTILLSTSYKSPTAVHFFSFSTDDKKLFPGIPDPEPAVIRTQVDLQGWSIEALSPTTTLLTLLDQSDPKGWSNKSSIPQQMVATLAGVGEYAIKCGGPPVATRFGGSKVASMKYDHEKATFKVEYEGSETRRHSLISANDMLSTTPEESVIDLSLPASTSRPKSISRPAVSEMPKVECEIRCDLDTWASIIELVVDPPPQGVTCLKRHRLSSGGGGLWITIEHDAMFVSDERLMVTVRKGTSSTGREKSGVIVNGLRTKVDVEELPESEVKTLAKQKRVKPARIPLDQPPVLGVIRRRRAEWEDDGDSDAAGSSGGAKGSGAKGASPPGPSPLTQFFVSAMQQTVNTTAAAATMFTPATSMSAPLSPTSSSDPSGNLHYPMARALKVLEYLLTQRGQSSGEGWTLASEKAGMTVTKKIETELSPVIPIHKADKVIEGISAGEVAHAITGYGCQKAWDVQLAGWTPLEDYGYGCSTAFVVRHSAFPFRDRGFWTATASAQLTRKTAASDGNDSALETTSLKAGTSPHSPTIIIASTSFSPSAVKSQFSSQKVNPLIYPTGNLIMSGWILEAIDPYQDDGNHPIPSTRCSHFVAIDYRGSVPVAFNNNMNATLPRTEILALESWLKSKAGLGAAAMTRLPASNLLVDSEVKPVPSTAPLEDVEDEPTEDHWQLEPRDSGRMLLSEDFNPQTMTYQVRIALEPGFLSAVADDETPRPPLIRPHPRRLSSVDYVTFRSGRVSPTPGPGTLPSVGSVASEASMESSASSLTVRGRRSSGTTTPLRQSSLHQRFPSSPQNSLPSTPYRSATLGRARKFSSASSEPMSERFPMDDPVVAEVVINPALFPRGYQITVASGDPPPSNPWDRSQAFSSLDSTTPFTAMVYTTPASPLLSMVNDKPAPRHLVCITLPTAQYYAPAILDPLTGENRPPPPKPSWVSDFESRGAIVELRIVGNTDTPASIRETSPRTTFNGKEIGIISERKSVAAVGRDYLEDDSVSSMPFLKRLSSPASTARAQKTLEEPRTIDASLLEELKAESQETLITDTVSPEPPAPLEAPKDEKENTTEGATEVIVPSPRPVSQLFSIWNASTSLLGWGPAAPAVPPVTSTPEPSATQPNGTSLDEPVKPEPDSSNAPSEAATSTTAVDTLLPRDLVIPRLYKLQTVIIIAVIAFLFGSLVRSLASPADFIYFNSISPDSDDALVRAVDQGGSGWREVRRLFEFKRGLFGWDVVIAVVRRPH
ncbi:hypothetical protein FRC04_008100 [Tulasnella sp. 424]|nr:hypothetical protein FRC04_008100 [Tulasnella sp. 424]KAG8974757.1 hypothetical protein FRC05_006917 [Tulasnella sp. 425]